MSETHVPESQQLRRVDAVVRVFSVELDRIVANEANNAIEILEGIDELKARTKRDS